MKATIKSSSSRSRRENRDLLKLSAELEKLKRQPRKPGRPIPAPLKEHALYLLMSGIPAVQVADVVGVTPEAIRQWRRSAEANGTLPTIDEVETCDDETNSPSDDGDIEEETDFPELDTEPTVTTPASAFDSLPAVKEEAVSTQPSRQERVAGLSPTEQAAILELKKRHLSMGPAQIQAQLRRFKGWKLSLKAISRVLVVNGYERVHVASRAQGDEEPHRFEAPHRNAIWQADFAELRVGPEKAPVLLVLDDFSRFVVAHRLMTEPTSEKVVEVLKEAIRVHGKPAALYTDRGGPFLAWRSPSSLGQFLEEELIDHYLSPPYKPQGRGKVEALVKTLRRELWDLIEFASREEACEGLAKFFREYNHHRAHMGIDGLTPADRFFGRWGEVRARVEHACRRREGALLHETGVGEVLRLSEESSEGAVEALRLVVVDGKLEVRLFGHRLVLGPLRI